MSSISLIIDKRPSLKTLATTESWCVGLFLFTLGFKLSIAYLFFFPGLICWLLQARSHKDLASYEQLRLHAPLLAFATIALTSAPFGVNPQKSISSVLMFSIFSLTPILVARRWRDLGTIPCFAPILYGQSLAALNALCAAATDKRIPRFLLGEVTQAGQFSTAIILCYGIVTLGSPNSPNRGQLRNAWPAAAIIGGGLPAVFLQGFPIVRAVCLTICLFVCAVESIRLVRDRTAGQVLQFAKAVSLPLLMTTLISSLKRGPIIGAIVGIGALSLKRSRTFFLLALTIPTLVILAIPAIHDRFAVALDHFFISGGRNTIWQIGWELSCRFPLGIGFKNSSILRDFSSEVPLELTHFHNNALNLLVETGWIGLSLYAYWIVTLLRSSAKKGITYSAINTAIVLGWQTAGLVEYNIGDKEVLLLIYATLAVVYGSSLSTSQTPETSPNTLNPANEDPNPLQAPHQSAPTI